MELKLLLAKVLREKEKKNVKNVGRERERYRKAKMRKVRDIKRKESKRK